ncbi:MAG: hypothetical protein G3M70_02920 [Candidatus Nitronauta litoralis]|uniref:Uncharacterized protein n=1 Tax=Candidatus Nitronauta litoralis TaxID=2705533 RepID=A0A7T0BTT1_9BACT|nr:MAG: hypothetical protein G3M70_02920 [Candidatus Nitronauta litoralis]
MMKRSNQKTRYTSLLVIFLAAVWAVVTILPTQLPAQDIDDVIQGLDQDFSFGGKEEVKQSNKAVANEQNREDIQIVAKEMLDAAAAHTNVIITYNAIIDPSNITVNSVADGITTLPVGETLNVVGSGVVGATIVTGINPGLVNTPLYISLTCNTAPNCNVSFSVGGGITCPLVTTGPFANGSTQTFTATCST